MTLSYVVELFKLQHMECYHDYGFVYMNFFCMDIVVKF